MGGMLKPQALGQGGGPGRQAWGHQVNKPQNSGRPHCLIKVLFPRDYHLVDGTDNRKAKSH